MSRFEHAILSSGNTFLSVNEYAAIMNISPIYLTECVKKATGKSAQKIIIDYKIQYAKTLLYQMEKPITDIAEVLGFNEVANFNQFFKRNTGITATQFRKKQE
jgi:AraC-like DNA-binding protein